MVQNPSRGGHGYMSAEHEAAEGSSVSPGTGDDIKVLHVKICGKRSQVSVYKRKISEACVVKVSFELYGSG